MKTIRYLNLLLLLTLTACEGCKKDEPKPKTELEKLPPITQDGKNTFGCLVNGKAYVPLSFDSRAVYQLGILQVFGNLFKPFRTIALVIRETNNGLLGNISYDLNKFPDSSGEASFEMNELISCTYKPEDCLSGRATLSKIERKNYIVAGTFDFTTVSQACDTLRITNGRFDIRYIP